jgi:hypothetical protein
MGRIGWTASVGAVALAMAGAYALHRGSGEPAPDTDPLAVVSAPVAIAHTDPAPSPAIALPAQSAARARPERALVTRLAAHDRRGGDVRVMAAAMDRLARTPAAAPVEATMTAAVTRIPAFATAGDSIHVSCVKTACEIAGLVPAGQTAATMPTVFRDKELERTMLARGFTPGPVIVADSGDGRAGFVFYLNSEF